MRKEFSKVMLFFESPKFMAGIVATPLLLFMVASFFDPGGKFTVKLLLVSFLVCWLIAILSLVFGLRRIRKNKEKNNSTRME